MKYLPHTDPIPAEHAVNKSVKRPDFTDPPDRTEIPQIVQITDHTDPADDADPHIKMCISCRSYIPHPGVQILQITQVPLW